jgi:rhamnulokinase
MPTLYQPLAFRPRSVRSTKGFPEPNDPQPEGSGYERMSMQPQTPPTETRASIAIDLGAESCRVSLLRWIDGKPAVQMVHRFPNHAIESPEGLRWDLTKICRELDAGLIKCAAIATEGVASIAVDGWSVDYVRMNSAPTPLYEPFCYRNERTVPIEKAVHETLSRERLYELTGTSHIRFNTIYQLLADQAAGVEAAAEWVMLPEFILLWLGAERVGEWTNATHTSLVQLDAKAWCDEIFDEVGLTRDAAPRLVPPGTVVGQVLGSLASLPAFADTKLIAAACHDTASAVAGIPAAGDDWAYLSSGTRSLIGTVLDRPSNTKAAYAAGFTNLGAVGGICFHKLVNGLWLLRQSMEQWAAEGQDWTVPDLVKAAESAAAPSGHIDTDDPDLLLPGNMVGRINAQRARHHLPSVTTAPEMARLIFESLAARYAQVLKDITQITGKKLTKLYIVGGGSQNQLLNRLTEQATGLQVLCGAVESSTIGNFAIQLAVLEGSTGDDGVDPEAVAKWAGVLI